jgi:hypothetical protein
MLYSARTLQRHFGWSIFGLIAQDCEQAPPETGAVPEPVALVGGLPLAALEWQVPPGRSGPEDPEDPAQQGAMIVAWPPGRRPLGREQGSDQFPLGVGQLCGRRGRCSSSERDQRTIPPPIPSASVASCRHSLMRSAPQRPLEAKGALFVAAGQRQEEASDLRHGDGDQAGIAAPFSSTSRWLAARRMTTRPACASRHRVTKRCQAAHVRTS